MGTVLSGQIPYIALDCPSDLGSAVASLTDLRPLKDLAKHAGRVKEKLSGELRLEKVAELSNVDSDLRGGRQSLQNLLGDVPQLADIGAAAVDGLERNDSDSLGRLIEEIKILQVGTLSEARTVLGDRFDPESSSVRAELKSSLAVALVSVGTSSIKKLESMVRLSALRGLDPKDLDRAEELAQTLESEALELSTLEQEPDRAARNRIYQRIAGWLRSRPDQLQSILDCPLCLRPFAGEIDPVFGDAISNLLEIHLKSDKPFLEKTLEAWASESLQRASAELPRVLQEELPLRPWDFISKALGEELFEIGEFKGCLAPLKDFTKKRCQMALANLPGFSEPSKACLPGSFGSSGSALELKLFRLRQSIAFVSWLKSNGDMLVDAYKQVVGTPGESDYGSGDSLRSKLTMLDTLVSLGKPLEECERQALNLSSLLTKRKNLQSRLDMYRRAVAAIEPLTHLDKLVEEQIGVLIERLSVETAKWKKSLFKAAIVGAPTFHRGDVGVDGRVELSSAVGGLIVPSQHIANASDLRATLIAFLLSFLEHVLQERGGLALLLLDDPQELFDPFNRRQLADSIPKMAKIMSVVVTTNDGAFREQVYQSMRLAGQAAQLDQLLLHPCSGRFGYARVTQLSRRIDELRGDLRKAENAENDEVARNYARELREFVEATLIDCLGAVEIIKEFELNALLKKVCTLSRDGHEPFSKGSFVRLIREFPPSGGNPTLELLSRAHHGQSPRVHFVEVFDALERLERLQSLAESARFDLELWLRRDLPTVEELKLPSLPEPASIRPRILRVVTELAAFSAAFPIGMPTESSTVFDPEWFQNKALYRLTTDNFGSSASAGQIAVVGLSEAEIEDGRLVIALYQEKIFARRLLRFGGRRDLVTLASEAENPLRRAPSLMLPVSQVRLLKVVGILFDPGTYSARGRDEATLLAVTERLQGAEVVFRVRGESAMPLALNDQWVLGGPSVTASEFSSLKGSIVALATQDQAYLKRVGMSVGGRDYRLFESIGFSGDSLLLRTEGAESETRAEVPGAETLIAARRVLGVLYDGSKE